MVEEHYGGLEKTQVNLWISKAVNDISLDEEGAEKLREIFKEFQKEPSREVFMYQKVGNVYQASRWEILGDLELLDSKRGLLSHSKLVEFAQDYFLDQKDLGQANIITYPQAVPRIKRLCDELLVVHPHPDYNPHSEPRPHYDMDIVPRE